jgi:aldose 1-epimerase
MQIRVSEFGQTAEGERVDAICLENGSGVAAVIISYGATLASLCLPDTAGVVRDCVLGYDTVAEYEQGKSYFGATVGRCASFIKDSRFELNGCEYTLTSNYDRHHIHGGTRGFSHQVWRWRGFQERDVVGVSMLLTSPDGDQGYPGLLEANVTYALHDRDELQIDYAATSDQATHVNMTHHSYFNLAGHDAGAILNQELTLNSGRYLVVDDELIPTGEIASVEGTPFDFRKGRTFGANIRRAPVLYDHTFLSEHGGHELALVAEAYDPGSGRGLHVRTTEPSVHLYTASHLRDEAGKYGTQYQSEHGFCLETQHYPNTPNRPQFPSTILKPKECYQSTTVYGFFNKK